MTIADEPGRGKAATGRIPTDILLLAIILLTGTLGFGLGVLAGKDMQKPAAAEGFWIEQLPQDLVSGAGGPASALTAVEAVSEPEPEGPKVYVASKNGTKYYLPTCGSAKRIKEENKVWFSTKGEAEAAGYGPAANCPGL